MKMGTNKVYINDLSDVSRLCRVCLTESKKMIPLNNQTEPKLEENISTLWHLLYRSTCMEITCDERYPSYICPMCLGLLNISYKFKLQFEESQRLLSEYFGEYLLQQPKEEYVVETSEIKPILELVHDQADAAPVELISKQGKYDLKDIFIIEVAEEEKPDFTGFLKNLGNEVSASFVNNAMEVAKLNFQQVNENNTISIINLNSHKRKFSNEVSDSADENVAVNNLHLSTKINLRDDMDEGDKKMNRKISKCAVCQKVFANKKYLQRHVENMHLHKKPTFVCEICGAFLKSRSSHYHHMVKHVGKRHKCNYCEKTYFNASNLQQHVRSVHTKERPHLCTVCGKSFSYSNALDYHMRIHTGERKYKCSYCDKTFTMQCGLNRHTRIHTGHRPYKCKFCEKAFRSKGEVNCHEMTHTGFRPYHCKYCKKGFTKTFNLKLHLLGHPGVHACEICNKTFIEPEFLKLHMKTAHGCLEEDEGNDMDS